MRTLFFCALVMLSAIAQPTQPPKSNAVDPDCKRNITEIIEARGFPAEEHYAITDDGFILGLFRIPPKAPGAPVVLLQHGVLDSSVTWFVGSGKVDETLPFMLANAGFDVWMGNNRGNRYSMNHVKLTPKDEAFWMWTADEMGKYDVPTMFNYIMKTSGATQVHYVGHSQGTQQIFMRLARELEGTYAPFLTEHLKTFVGLGPVTAISHMKNEALRIMLSAHTLEVFRDMHVYNFMPNSQTLNKLFPAVCKAVSGICDGVVEFICGWDKGAMNDSRMDVMAAQEPGGCSTFDLIHWGQMYRNKEWRACDWGATENMKRYGQSQAPLYPAEVLRRLNTTRTAVQLFSGSADVLADDDDLQELLLQLPPTVVHETLAGYAHLDFVWAMDAPKRIFGKIMTLLNSRK